MATETIFQHWIFNRFALPFLFIFFIVFAILEKTKIFGDDKKQLNALVAFVIGLVFVSFAYPQEVVQNLILFLTVALVVMFVAMILWGFVSGQDMEKDIIGNKGLKWTIGIAIVLVVFVAVVWAMGIEDTLIGYFFNQSWSGTFWTNFAFIVVVGIALALVLKNNN